MGGLLYIPALLGEVFWTAAILSALGTHQLHEYNKFVLNFLNYGIRNLHVVTVCIRLRNIMHAYVHDTYLYTYIFRSYSVY